MVGQIDVSGNSWEIRRGKRFYIADIKFNIQSVHNSSGVAQSHRTVQLHEMNRARLWDASCSLKEISGQVEGKLEMQLTHLHGRSRNS